MCEGWLEKGRCSLPIKVECWCKEDCCWVEVNLATLTCWGSYQILNIGQCLLIMIAKYDVQNCGCIMLGKCHIQSYIVVCVR